MHRYTVEPAMERVGAPGGRHLTAWSPGVRLDELVPETSLVDEPAVDLLGLLDLTLSTFGMTIRRRVLGRIRALGGLLEASGAQVGVRADGGAWAPEPPLVRARLVSPRGGVLERVGFLTSYAAETIAEDARHAGRGACLDLAVDGKGTTNATLAQVRVQFGRLVPFGVRVRVRRGRHHLDPAMQTATKCDDTREEVGLGNE